VLPKITRVLDSNDVHLIVRVVVAQVSHNIELHLSLMFKFILISDNLDCNYFACFVIFAFDRLAEATLTQEIQNFESEC
jgi:hypothetical protein